MHDVWEGTVESEADEVESDSGSQTRSEEAEKIIGLAVRKHRFGRLQKGEVLPPV
jgi:hypothetical protein